MNVEAAACSEPASSVTLDPRPSARPPLYPLAVVPWPLARALLAVPFWDPTVVQGKLVWLDGSAAPASVAAVEQALAGKSLHFFVAADYPRHDSGERSVSARSL